MTEKMNTRLGDLKARQQKGEHMHCPRCGADYKETRRILMGHLTGFAAFKSAADMEAHKERQAQRRRERREEAQG